MIHNVNHERLHFEIVDLIRRVHVFQLFGIPKAVSGHQLRQALSEHITILQFCELVGGHRVGVLDPELVVLGELSGEETVVVEVLAVGGDATLDVVAAEGVPVSVDAVDEVDTAPLFEKGMLDAALLDVWATVVDVAVCVGVEVELTNGGVFSMYEPFGCAA